jgi:hypothetical protein
MTDRKAQILGNSLARAECFLELVPDVNIIKGDDGRQGA